jgi:HNH endonuclease
MERSSSVEHVFPLAIGGTITTERVCPACNSALGSPSDAALIDFLPIRIRRAMLGLAGRGRESPSQFDILLGEQELIGPAANRIRTRLNKTTGKLDIQQLPHREEIALADGTKVLQVTLDERDKDKIPKIIQRERKRRGLSLLSDEALAVEAQKFTVNSIENPLVRVDISVKFEYLRHAMMKIAYELAFLWLGESYLDDPVAISLRKAILSKDIEATAALEGYVGWAEACDAFKFWTPHEAHHLAYAMAIPGAICIAARVFDIYSVVIPVSKEPGRYIRNVCDSAKLRFIAIDSVSGKTVDTTFDSEQRRIAAAMSRYRRLPPFPDPLTQSHDDSHEGSDT